MSEIYIRQPSKTNYSDKTIETTNTLEMFMQQIEMLLSTKPTTILGSTEIGVGLEYYLHTLRTTETDMVRVINNQIKLHCSFAAEYSYNVGVTFYEVGQSDAAIIEITVEDANIIRVIVE